MPIPTKPTLTPYADQLPDVNNPATWNTRTVAFWTWTTGDGYVNLSDTVTYSEDALDYIDAALADSETIVDAVADIQSRIGNVSTAEFNRLDGITATTAELNYTDGVTSPIQDQLDSKVSSVIAGTGLLGGGTSGDVTVSGQTFLPVTWNEGTNAVEGVISPAKLKGAIESQAVFTKAYESQPQTITTSGTLTLAHGLGGAPKTVHAFLECVIDQFGYVVGDVFSINQNVNGVANGSYGHSIICDDTNLRVQFGFATPTYQAVNRTNGAINSLANANFKLILRAYA